MSHKKTYRTTILIVLVFILFSIVILMACVPNNMGSVANNTVYNMGSGMMVGQLSPAQADLLMATIEANDGTTVLTDVSRSVLAQQEEQTQKRVILKDAILSLTVDDPETRLAEIATMTEDMGGWVVNSTINRYTDSSGKQVAHGSILVRVPAERLAETLETIKTGAEEINSENLTGRDVTQEYVDMSSRLKNLEAAEIQLQSIMDSAKKVEDVINIYTELVEIRGQIESIKGQLQYFDEASAFSSIRVDLTPPSPSPVIAQTSGWNPISTAEGALGALVSVVRGLVDIVITLVVFFGPIAIVIGGLWWTVRRACRRTPPSAES